MTENQFPTNNFQGQYYAPQPPPPQKSRHGCLGLSLVAIFIAIAASAVASMMLAVAFSGLAEALSTVSPTDEFEVISEGDGSSAIAVIDFKGVIASDEGRDNVTPEYIEEALEAAGEQEGLKALIIDMDSPGGEVLASDEIHSAIMKFRESHEGVHVLTCMHSMGASGGYYVAAATEYIVANRMTMTGSIGVIMSSFNAEGLLDKLGVKAVPYKSGAMKDMLSPTRQPSEAEREYIERMIRSTFSEFAQIVADGRKEHFKTREDVMAAEFADGRVLSGADALGYGLVDELGGLDEACLRACEMAGVEEPTVLRYKKSESLLDSLLEMKSGGLAGQGGLLPFGAVKVKAGQLYYLAPQAMPW